MSVQENNLQAIADAIRSKDGTSEPIKASDFANRISAIQVGVDTSDATATASNIDRGKTAYVNGTKITGTSTKVDTSDATVTADTLKTGVTAYGASGQKITGTKDIPSYTAGYIKVKTTVSNLVAYSPVYPVTNVIGYYSQRGEVNKGNVTGIRNDTFNYDSYSEKIDHTTGKITFASADGCQNYYRILALFSEEGLSQI